MNQGDFNSSVAARLDKLESAINEAPDYLEPRIKAIEDELLKLKNALTALPAPKS